MAACPYDEAAMPQIPLLLLDMYDRFLQAECMDNDISYSLHDFMAGTHVQPRLHVRSFPSLLILCAAHFPADLVHAFQEVT
mgnify:CR=1 FL=1|jgi:hypothetical protein